MLCLCPQQSGEGWRARQADGQLLAPGDGRCLLCLLEGSLARMRCCRWPLYGPGGVIFGREELQRLLSAEGKDGQAPCTGELLHRPSIRCPPLKQNVPSFGPLQVESL